MIYTEYEMEEQQKTSTIQAQYIYDLRDTTGFISGTDLHDLFREVLDGEPSPAGNAEIPIEKLEATWNGAKALKLLRKPLLEMVAGIRAYKRT